MDAGTPRAARANGVALVVLAGTCWSIGGIVVRLITDAGPWHIVFYRSLTLALTLAVVLLVRYGSAWMHAVRAAGWPRWQVCVWQAGLRAGFSP